MAGERVFDRFTAAGAQRVDWLIAPASGVAPSVSVPDPIVAVFGVTTVVQFSAVGTEPITWSALTPLPSGVTLTAAGRMTIGPAVPIGTMSISLRAANAAGQVDVSRALVVQADVQAATTEVVSVRQEYKRRRAS